MHDVFQPILSVIRCDRVTGRSAHVQVSSSIPQSNHLHVHMQYKGLGYILTRSVYSSLDNRNFCVFTAIPVVYLLPLVCPWLVGSHWCLCRPCRAHLCCISHLWNSLNNSTTHVSVGIPCSSLYSGIYWGEAWYPRGKLGWGAHQFCLVSSPDPTLSWGKAVWWTKSNFLG